MEIVRHTTLVRVFYSKKTELLLKKFELTQWRILVQQQITQRHQELSDNWNMCAIGERVKREGKKLKNIKDLSPQAIKLGYDFSVALQEKDSDKALEIIEQIEKLPTIWRNDS